MKSTAVLLVLLLLASGCKREENAGAPGAKKDGKTTAAATATGTEVGLTLPEYSAMNLDGSKFELAGKKGSVVLLNLWATWCGPCRYEIPELQRIHDA